MWKVAPEGFPGSAGRRLRRCWAVLSLSWEKHFGIYLIPAALWDWGQLMAT